MPGRGSSQWGTKEREMPQASSWPMSEPSSMTKTVGWGVGLREQEQSLLSVLGVAVGAPLPGPHKVLPSWGT